MSANKNTATLVGALFILGFAGVLTAVFTAPILNAPDYLIQVSANPNQIIMGAFFQFVMAAACAGIGISLYPVLNEYNQGLALGAAGFRIVEAVLDMVGVVILLLLVTLSQEFVKAGAPESSYFQTAGVLFLAANAWVNNVVVLLAWCIGALMYYYIFYQTRLIPRWLAGWGLIGCTLTIVSSTLVMFRLVGPFGAIQSVMNLPIALQELVLAIWLIVKGFRPSAMLSSLPKSIRSTG